MFGVLFLFHPCALEGKFEAPLCVMTLTPTVPHAQFQMTELIFASGRGNFERSMLGRPTTPQSVGATVAVLGTLAIIATAAINLICVIFAA